MKILLFGKNGQVGWELQRSLAPLGEVVALGSDGQELCGNFTDLNGIAQTVRSVSPDVIVNAAAYTFVDKAESEPEFAHLINAQAPQVLAQEAKKIGALFVHYSTDFVFDGSGDTPWDETDTCAPINAYGMSKYQGEVAIQAANCSHLIFRSSWIYAARGNNFAKTMLKLGSERSTLKIINDQIGAPTGADLIADITAHAICQTLSRREKGGLYHLAAAGAVTWYDYARFLLDYARHEGAVLKVGPDAITQISSGEYTTPARRPRNSRLDVRKLQSVFNIHLPEWQSGVARMLQETLHT